MKTETTSYTSTTKRLVLNYEDLLSLLGANGIQVGPIDRIELCTESDGSCGQRHRQLFSMDRVVVQVSGTRRA